MIRNIFPHHMMATKALHKLGDISRDEPDLCWVNKETKYHFIGHWETGFGMINVKFPKETTRELTKDEVGKYNKMHIAINNTYMGKVKVVTL
jgi:hypothetical protein